MVSPGAALFYNDSIRKHFVDGGYFENTGTETLIEVMKRLDLKQLPIKPYVLQFNFGQKDSVVKNTSIRTFSEVMEIIGAIYNTRSGRSNLSRLYLQQFVDGLHGVFIPLYLNVSTQQVPLNWILSNAAVDRADKAVGELVKPGDGSVPDSADKNELHRLFVYKPEQ